MSDTKPTNATWTIGQLFLLTAIAAILSSLAVWLGKPYGFFALIPITLTTIVLLLLRGKTALGAFAGWFISLWIAAILVRFDSVDPRYYRAVLTLSLFGSVFGTCFHAMRLKRYVIGLVPILIASYSLMVISFSTSVQEGKSLAPVKLNRPFPTNSSSAKPSGRP